VFEPPACQAGFFQSVGELTASFAAINACGLVSPRRAGLMTVARQYVNVPLIMAWILQLS